MDLWKILFFLTLSSTHISAARILAILGTDMNSHFKIMTGVLEAISPHHEITFYVHPRFNYKYDNITTKTMPQFDINKDLSKNIPLKDPCRVDDYSIYTNIIMHSNMKLYDTIYQSPSIGELMRQKGEYDLLLINAYGTQHLIPLAHHLGIQMIQVSPSIVDIWVSEALNNRDHWDTDPSFEISDKADSFYGRLKRYIKNAYLWYVYRSNFEATINKAITKYYPKGTPPLDEIMATKTNLVFANTHRAMGITKPASQAVIEIGGNHVSPRSPLTPELQSFMDAATDGVIYFSLGTVVQGESMNKDIIKAMLRTFSKLKQKVLWKIKDDLEDVPENVVFGKWFPQQDILRHRNTKVFISQGGMLSMIEACTMGVPTLIMPVLFDQKTNAQKAEELGYGITLHFCQFTEERFHSALTNLLGNQSYARKARQVSRIMQQHQETLKEDINFWTNFVLENKGPTVILNQKKQSWLSTIPADIFLTLIVATVAMLAAVSYLFKKVYPLLNNNLRVKID